MNRSLLPRLLALGTVMFLAAAGVPVATAQTPTDDCPGAGSSVVTGNIKDPDEGQVVPAASTSIRGCFEYGSDVVGPLGTISKVTISLLAGRAQVLPGGASNVVLFDGPPARAVEFSWSTPSLAWNGPYTAKVVVEGSARPPGGRQPNVTAERRFMIETAPAPPADVKAVPEGEDGVTVSWDKNKEPDIVLYEVHRAPRGGDFTPVAQAAANLTTLNDRPSVGDWRYVVIAIRRGAADDGIASGPSKEAEAAVVVPPAPSTTTTAPGGAGAGEEPPPTTLQRSGSGIVITSATTGAGGAARPAGGGGRVDLSRFGSLGRSTTRQIDAPDPGFEETLPFAPGDQPTVAAEDETQELGADDPNSDRAVGQDLISDDSERRRSLTFVAFGLLLFVMSMGGLWMRGEVKRADELEALEPTPAPPATSGPPAPRAPTLPGPLPGPSPGSNGARVPASTAPDVYAPPPPTRRPKPAPPTPRRRLRPPEPAATAPSTEPVSVAPAPALAEAAGAAATTSERADRRSARRAARQADPLAGMTPLSPPPPRPWSARQPLDAPALDVPDPEPEPEPEPARGSTADRRARRSERRLPVR